MTTTSFWKQELSKCNGTKVKGLVWSWGEHHMTIKVAWEDGPARIEMHPEAVLRGPRAEERVPKAVRGTKPHLRGRGMALSLLSYRPMVQSLLTWIPVTLSPQKIALGYGSLRTLRDLSPKEKEKDQTELCKAALASCLPSLPGVSYSPRGRGSRLHLRELS